MTDMTAAFGIEQLRRVNWFIEQKSRIASIYNEAFRNHELISVPYLPAFVDQHSWYMYCIRLKPTVCRNEVISIMKNRGVDSRLSFPPIPLQPIYKKLYGYSDRDFPRAVKIFNSFIDIPCWVGMTDDEIDQVIQVITQTVESVAASNG